MTTGEKGLRFVARALGSATLWGVLVQFAGEALLKQKTHIGLLLLMALAVFLLLMLIAKLVLHIRYPAALWHLGRAYVSGVVMGFAMAALILLLTELLTALVSMMTLIGYGG